MVEQAHQTTGVSVRYWNGKTASLFILVALVCASVFVLRQGPFGYISIFIAFYCFLAALVLLLGVALEGGEISFPRPIVRAFPFLVMGRMRRAVGELDEITYLGHSFGSEWVILRFGDEQYPAPFVSREQRLAFFDAVQAKKPDVRIYRAY